MARPVATILHVEKYKGRNVFRLGTIRFDKCMPEEAIPKRSNQDSTLITVMRNGALFDTGEIVFIGGHDGSYHFAGLPKIYFTNEETLVRAPIPSLTLNASWFEHGDEVHLAVSAFTLRRGIILNYYHQLTASRRYRALLKQFEKKENQLLALHQRAFKRGEMNEKAYQKVLLKVWLETSASIDAELAREKLPDVIFWKYPWA